MMPSGPGRFVMNPDLVVAIADAVMTTVIAVIALYYAHLQAKIHRGRVNSEERDRRVQRQYELFERRWKSTTR